MKPPLKNFNRQAARRDNLSEEDFQEFIEAFNAGALPALELTDEEKAQDLVEEAYELSPAKANKNIEKALALNPDCIEAYEYLAGTKETPEESIEMYDKGIAIGRRIFGGKFLEKNKGIFWGIHETRSFMRCLHDKASILLMIDKTEESVAIMEEMLELNDHDNQGIRFPLISTLAMLGDAEKFKKYDEMFANDDSTQMLYPRALFAFNTEGNTASARKKAIKAFTHNPFVLDILAKITRGDFEFSVGKPYAPGSPEEAEIYLMHGVSSWLSSEKTFSWLFDTAKDFVTKEMAKEMAKKPAAVKNEKGQQIIDLAQKFCREVLKDEEYAELAEKMVLKMSRKRQVPYETGKVEIWAAAVIHALGTINFLFDKSFEPYTNVDEINEFFGTKKSTTGNKSREIRDLLKLSYWDKEFSTKRMASGNPFEKLMMSADGLVVPK